MTNKSIRIQVQFMGSFRDLVGKEDEIVEINGNTVRDLIEKLRRLHGDRFVGEIYDQRTDRLSANFVFLLNGKSISSVGGLDVEVKENDRASFVMMVGGG